MKDSGIPWIGEIPEGWNINTVFQIFTQVKNKNSDLSENNLLSLSYGKIKRKSIDTTEGLLPESFDGYNIIEEGDIVLRLTDLQNDQRSLRVGISEERGIVTSAYVTLRNRSSSFPRYLYYYLHSFDICKGFYGMGGGIRQGINWDGLKWIKVLTPSIEEQNHIVSFLDSECACIDAVIEKTRASIEEYKKLKQAVITEAVTKGIRPGRKMKDSGIEWIGEIPEEWEVVLGHRIIIDTQNGLTRRDLDESAGQIVLKLKNITADGKISYSDTNRINLTQEEIKRYCLSDGDFLFVRVNGSKSLVGKCAIFENKDEIIAYNDHIIRVRLNSLMNRRFFQMYLQSMPGRIEIDLRTSTAAGQFTISGEGLRDLQIILPPADEQLEIIAYLEERCDEIDALITSKQQLLTELESYKKAVIYEYVTGKKEVV